MYVQVESVFAAEHTLAVVFPPSSSMILRNLLDLVAFCSRSAFTGTMISAVGASAMDGAMMGFAKI